MTCEYQLAFKASALKEWKKLGAVIQAQLKKKLQQRLRQPHVPADALSGMQNCYKVKLRSAGYRLVYEVEDEIVTVTVIAVGKRERGEVYSRAQDRL